MRYEWDINADGDFGDGGCHADLSDGGSDADMGDGGSDDCLKIRRARSGLARIGHCKVAGFGRSSRSKAERLLENGALCDISPTLLQMMGLKQPEQMTGRSLIELCAEQSETDAVPALGVEA